MRGLVLGSIVFVLVTGCTFREVTPWQVGAPPAQPPSTLVLGHIGVANPLWEGSTQVFRRGVWDWLGRNGGFQSVLIEAPTSPPPDSVVLKGTITDISRGSEALRVFVGWGLGSPWVRGTFDITRLNGTVLNSFTARGAYSAGAGGKAAHDIDVDDLMRQFAETVAKATRRWAQSKGVQ